MIIASLREEAAGAYEFSNIESHPHARVFGNKKMKLRNKIKVSAELQLNNMLFKVYLQESVTLSGSSCLYDEVGLLLLISYPLLVVIHLGK